VDFVAIDVETANQDPASICQVGIASFRGGALAEAWESLVNPQDFFSYFNVSVHGIFEETVQGAPTWARVFPEVESRLANAIVVSHTPFDRRALARACRFSGLETCACTWLDSARVARKAWPQFARAGYNLPNLAMHFGILYRAHNALEDARCAGLILLRAVAETGLSPAQWLERFSPAACRVRSRSRSHA
jgi:DNA polymerase III subunit epsilon